MKMKRNGGHTAKPDPANPKAGVAFTAETATRLALTAEGYAVCRRNVPVMFRRTRKAAPVAA